MKLNPLVWAIRVALFGLLLVLAGCAPAPVVKTQTVEVPRYVRTHIDASLTAPCVYAEPDPACYVEGKREFCNGQLRDMRTGYRDALMRCNADKAAIRAAGTAAALLRSDRTELGAGVFDPVDGRLIRLGDLELDGPRLDVWRAPIDNDRWFAREPNEVAWREIGLNRMRHRIDAIEAGEFDGGAELRVFSLQTAHALLERLVVLE